MSVLIRTALALLYDAAIELLIRISRRQSNFASSTRQKSDSRQSSTSFFLLWSCVVLGVTLSQSSLESQFHHVLFFFFVLDEEGVTDGLMVMERTLIGSELEIVRGVVRLVGRHVLGDHLSHFHHAQLLNLKEVIDEDEELLCIGNDARLDVGVASSKAVGVPALAFALEDCEVGFAEGKRAGRPPRIVALAHSEQLLIAVLAPESVHGNGMRHGHARQKVGAKMDIVVREFILVFVCCLTTVLSRTRTATLLVGTVFIATQELAEVGNADNRLAASEERGIVASTKHGLLVEDVLLPSVSSLGDTAGVEVTRAN
ncbi:hypothetical protein KCU81_g115, partial [Aureobasidium melanogenum]